MSLYRDASYAPPSDLRPVHTLPQAARKVEWVSVAWLVHWFAAGRGPQAALSWAYFNFPSISTNGEKEMQAITYMTPRKHHNNYSSISSSLSLSSGQTSVLPAIVGHFESSSDSRSPNRAGPTLEHGVEKMEKTLTQSRTRIKSWQFCPFVECWCIIQKYPEKTPV